MITLDLLFFHVFSLHLYYLVNVFICGNTPDVMHVEWLSCVLHSSIAFS
jgi:hypothetical protein